jgi:hypothetical protein
MTRKERMLLPAGMGGLFAGLMLKRFGGESWPVLVLMFLFYGVSISCNIRYMLLLRDERAKGGDEGDG